MISKKKLIWVALSSDDFRKHTDKSIEEAILQKDENKKFQRSLLKHQKVVKHVFGYYRTVSGGNGRILGGYRADIGRCRAVSGDIG